MNKDIEKKVEEKIKEIMNRPMNLDFVPQYQKNLEEAILWGISIGREEKDEILEKAFRLFCQGNTNENSEIQVLSPEDDQDLIWGGLFGEEIGKQYVKFKLILNRLSVLSSNK